MIFFSANSIDWDYTSLEIFSLDPILSTITLFERAWACSPFQNQRSLRMSSKKTGPAHAGKWQKFAEQEAQQEKINIEDIDAEPDFSTAEAKQPDGLTYPSHEELEQQLNALEMQLAEYKDVAIRAKAEADNARRRAERDVQDAHKFGGKKILTDLLPVVDSLVRGLEGPEPQDPQAQSYRQGMTLTLDILEKTLEKHGVQAIAPAKGEAFDPARHEAMSMQPDPQAKSNTILQVLQKGYELNGRVIRAAMVIVAA